MRAALAVLLIPLTVMVAMGLESRGPSPEQLMVDNRSHHLALAAFDLYGFHVERRPRIIWHMDKGWQYAALADCGAWTLEIDYHTTRNQTAWVLDELLPHEYGHFLRCFEHGDIGLEDPHDQLWASYVRALGGNPASTTH